jgi:hypothetical protein
MRQTVRAVVVVLLLVLGASPLRAQNPGLPVYNIGVPRGIGLYGDVGFPNDAAGSGTAYGATGRVGFGALGVTASLSTLDPDGPGGSDVGVGGTLNYRVFGGPLVPLTVTLQAGMSWSQPDQELIAPGGGSLVEESNLYHYPIGVGFALVIPNPTLAIHPWLAPRVDVTTTKISGSSETDTNFGLSGGLEFNFLNGFGLQAAYDRVFTGDSDDPGTFAAGAHYAFRVPGL